MIAVRRLGREDAAVFRDIRLASLREAPEAYGSTLADWVDTGLETFAARTETSIVLGGYLDGHLDGLAILDREKGGHTRHRGLLTAVFVHQAARRKGVAAALLAEVARAARAEKLSQVELAVADGNADALQLYQRMGYRVWGRHPRGLRVGGRFIDEFQMVLMLDE